jgi:hypothetical protein
LVRRLADDQHSPDPEQCTAQFRCGSGAAERTRRDDVVPSPIRTVSQVIDVSTADADRDTLAGQNSCGFVQPARPALATLDERDLDPGEFLSQDQARNPRSRTDVGQPRSDQSTSAAAALTRRVRRSNAGHAVVDQRSHHTGERFGVGEMVLYPPPEETAPRGLLEQESS